MISNPAGYVRDRVEIQLNTGVVVRGIIYDFSSKNENKSTDDFFIIMDEEYFGTRDQKIAIETVNAIKVLDFRILGRYEDAKKNLQLLGRATKEKY